MLVSDKNFLKIILSEVLSTVTFIVPAIELIHAENTKAKGKTTAFATHIPFHSFNNRC
jgi:hypothetical protein